MQGEAAFLNAAQPKWQSGFDARHAVGRLGKSAVNSQLKPRRYDHYD